MYSPGHCAHLVTRELAVFGHFDRSTFKTCCWLDCRIKNDGPFCLWCVDNGYIWQRHSKVDLSVYLNSGPQYPGVGYRCLLKNHGFIGILSRVYICWNNSLTDNFFGRLKQDCVQRHYCQTCNEAIDTSRIKKRILTGFYLNAWPNQLREGSYKTLH